MKLQTQHIEHPEYIDDSATLTRLCQQWQACDALALDTEFIRTDTFYPIGALIQVSDGKGCFLIDPLAVEDFSAFKELLVNPAVTKVLHSCSEDLEVFDRLFGLLPHPLIDTQIAAALDGRGFSLGYQRMVDDLLQIHVPKGETRSNWLQRPLTSSQIHYAALDVAYLLEVYQLLRDSLHTKGRWQWLQQDCQRMLDQYGVANSPEQYYLKVKSAWKLSPSQLAVLKSVVEWREHTAREADKPRGRILKDRPCMEIALKSPSDSKALAAIDDIGPGTVRRYAESILQAKKAGQSCPEDELPDALPAPLPPSVNALMKQMKSHVKHRAEQLLLAPEMLVRKKDYEALIRSGFRSGNYVLPESLSDWRQAVIGEGLLSIASLGQ